MTWNIPLCPGSGVFTRAPGKVTGTTDVYEWQWAQGAMFGYFYADFMSRYGPGAMVLSEAAYTRLLTGTLADEFLGRMNVEFRRDSARSGALRPDILGFCPKPPRGARIILELLEVSTERQAVPTLRDDVNYKLGKFSQIISGLGPSLAEEFSLASYAVSATASKWKPRAAFQRLLPLPLRTDPSTNTVFVEWICFEPTFRVNPPNGIDGLLLYEIHSMPIKSGLIPNEVMQRVTDAEKRNRQALRVAYGQTLTPWITSSYLENNLRDRQALLVFLSLLGVALLAVACVYFWPVVAGVGLDLAIDAASAGVGTEVSGAALVQSTSGLSATVSTGMDLMTALGRPVAAFAVP